MSGFQLLGTLRNKLLCTLGRLRQQLRHGLRACEIRLRRTVRTDFLLRVPPDAIEALRPWMSALLRKRTNKRLPCYVRLVPIADLSRCNNVRGQKLPVTRSPRRRWRAVMAAQQDPACARSAY